LKISIVKVESQDNLAPGAAFNWCMQCYRYTVKTYW